MRKMLVFGGPGLPPGTHTVYETKDGEHFDPVQPGHKVDFDSVVRAEEYVEREQASVVEVQDAE